MATASAKISVSVPAELLREVRERVGARRLSWFVSQAMRNELDREQLGSWLAELEAENGALDPVVLADVRAAWPKR